MLIRRQDLAVLSLYCLGYSSIRSLVLRVTRRPAAIFVTFHDIPPFAVDCFESNLHFLKRSTNVVCLDDFFEGRLSVNKINVVITFDDGYRSWVTVAAPLLKKLELQAAFFITSGFVGLSSEEQADFMRTNLRLKPDLSGTRGGLSIEDVRTLHDGGFTIGGHTVNHHSLDNVADRAKLRYEIACDKANLEMMSGAKLQYFAYPFGAYKNPHVDIAEILCEVGYRGAVTTVAGLNGVSTNPYLLHRELTPALMSPWVFRARACGNYEAVRFLKRQINKTVCRG